MVWNAQSQGQWNTSAGVMVENVKESGHPICRVSRALDRGFLTKKRWTMYDSLQC